MRAVAYIRCSTEGQATEGVSLQTQIEAVRKYADYKSLAIVEEIQDAGISGGINKARDGFIRLLNRVQAGDVQVIILFSLERLSRDMLTLLALERLLDEYEVELHTIEGQVNPSTPDGFMNFAMKAFMGEMERRQVKYRTRKALEYKKGNGKVFNHVPYGYRRAGNELVADLSEQSIIRTINAMYQEGKRLVDIGYLNSQGIPTKQGKEWTPQTAKRLIDGYENVFKKGQTKLTTATRAFIEAIA
jgi:site-specific DNA recombinase